MVLIMCEVWLTPAGNLRVYRQAPIEYTNRANLELYFEQISARRYTFMIAYGYEYLGEL